MKYNAIYKDKSKFRKLLSRFKIRIINRVLDIFFFLIIYIVAAIRILKKIIREKLFMDFKLPN